MDEVQWVTLVETITKAGQHSKTFISLLILKQNSAFNSSNLLKICSEC